MKISKRSWHYRLLAFWTPQDTGGRKIPEISFEIKNFCTYFGLVIYYVFVSITVTIVLILFSPVIVIGFVGYGIFLFIDKAFPDRKKQKIDREPTSLIGKWLKAKKERICPLVEFTE